MKIVGAIQGYAALRENVEEFMPERGIVQSEMVELIAERYQFQGFPQFQPGAPPQPSLNFIGGKFSTDDNEQSFAIVQLAMYPHGDVVIAIRTDQAEIILNDLTRLLNQHLGFRLMLDPAKKLFLSNVVVEFDAGLEVYIDKIMRMNNVINSFRPGKEPFNIKRLAFGIGDITMPNDVIAAIESADFVIERRQGAAYELNRYFCSAPMTTHDHLSALQQIEAVARADAD